MQTVPVIVAMMFAAAASQNGIPPVLFGDWVVGAPYDMGQPIGLDASQEKKIRSLKIELTGDHIDVCGKTVPVKSVNVEDLRPKQFLARYGFLPSRVGLRGSHITEVTINGSQSTNACGGFEDPGTDLFVSDRKVVMQTGNDYFPLKRRPD